MKQETKNCQNCKKDFVIKPDDFDFYKKINVPAPTFCPECRLINRKMFRNERTLYHKVCDLCGKGMVTMYSPEAPFPVFCSECWWGDKWDPMSYGIAVDLSKPFFLQMKELQMKVPRPNLGGINNTNSPYLNYAWFSSNSYMCWDLGYGENVCYSNACHFIKDSLDCSYCKKMELCYWCIYSNECSRSAYLKNCENCLDSYFLLNCRNCSSCLLCENLRNKNYCIRNVQYTKEEFEAEKRKLLDGGSGAFEAALAEFKERITKTISKENNNVQVTNCSGDNIIESKNCRSSFNVFKSENCVFVHDIDSDVKDSMDLSNAAEGELLYGGTSMSGRRLLWDIFISSSFDVTYSVLCSKNNNNLFGCVSLNSKSYCILNKQYTKEEYEALIPKIKEHMSDVPYVSAGGINYRYGEFFPPEFSPFAYNETMAHEHSPITKERALELGYRWKEPELKDYKVSKKPEELSGRIGDIPDSVLNEVIGCAHQGKCGHQCATAFKIVPQELTFYRRMNLPIPKLCPNCRHFERLALRNPLKLWHRKCQCAGVKSENSVYQNISTHQHKDSPCPTEFETSYSPERKEIVYCESCYNSEVV